MSTKAALIIFQKNVVYGKVKTRLAATVGNDEAMWVYQQLLRHTYAATKGLAADKIVFYSDYKERADWDDAYQKKIQQGNDLGERMKQAFEDIFQNGYQKVIIIGTDCPELTERIIIDAFERLERYTIVIGPAADGGYYLLGMKALYPQLFENIHWSTDKVLSETLQHCRNNHLSYCLLSRLHDVDEEKDLVYMKTIV